MIGMTRNEWICRECEDSPDDIVIDGITRMQEIDHETEELYLKDSICSVVYATRVCDRCQVVKVCYKRKSLFKEPELEVVAVLEEVESVKETLDILEDKHYDDLTPDLEEEARKAEIARLKAQLAELEK